MEPKYVIDTCSLTEMRRRYPQDVFPAAWEKLTELAVAQIVISVDSVLNELESPGNASSRRAWEVG